MQTEKTPPYYYTLSAFVIGVFLIIIYYAYVNLLIFKYLK